MHQKIEEEQRNIQHVREQLEERKRCMEKVQHTVKEKHTVIFLLHEFTDKVVDEHMTCTVNPRARTSTVDKGRTDCIG